MSTITTAESPQVPLQKEQGNATESTVPKVEASPTRPDHHAEIADSDGENEPQGALQQIMTRNEQIVTHILYVSPQGWQPR